MKRLKWINLCLAFGATACMSPFINLTSCNNDNGSGTNIPGVKKFIAYVREAELYGGPETLCVKVVFRIDIYFDTTIDQVIVPSGWAVDDNHLYKDLYDISDEVEVSKKKIVHSSPYVQNIHVRLTDKRICSFKYSYNADYKVEWSSFDPEVILKPDGHTWTPYPKVSNIKLTPNSF